jgi:hypothetical protein
VIPCRIIHLQTRFLRSGLHWLRSGTRSRGRKQSPLACLYVRVCAHGRQSASETDRQSEILERHSHACIRRKLALPRQLLMIRAGWSRTCHGGPPSTHHQVLTQVVTQPSQCIRYHHLSKIPGPGPTRSMEKTRVWKEGKRVICIRKTHVIHQMFYLPDVLTLVARCFIFARCLNFLCQIFYFFNHLRKDLDIGKHTRTSWKGRGQGV